MRTGFINSKKNPQAPMTKSAIAICILAISCTAPSIAQTNDQIIDELISEAAESDDEDAIINAQASCEYLQDMMQNRTNINTDNIPQLQSIPFMSQQQIMQISEYRSSHGPIMSTGELKALLNRPGRKAMEMFRAFLETGIETSADTISIREMLSGGRHTIAAASRYSATEYYTPSAAQNQNYGGPATVIKYRYNCQNHIAWGITAEKDQGEKLGFGNQKYGFDFYSMHLKIQNLGKIDRIIIGDYSARFGQGLVLGGGFSMGRQIQNTAMAGPENTIHEHTSSAESNYYRGAAASIRLGRTSISAMMSSDLADATCYDSTTFATLKTDGYHRTARELSRKNNLRQTDLAIAAHHTIKSLKIGAAIHYYSFSKRFVPREILKNTPLAACQNGLDISASYSLSGTLISLSGETAIDRSRNLATANTIHIYPTEALSISILQRHYGKAYHTFGANAPGATSHATNEDGLYIACQLMPIKSISLYCWADIYRHPWATSQSKEPSTGRESMAQIRIQPARKATFQLKAKNKTRTVSGTYGDITRSQYISATIRYAPAPPLAASISAYWSRYTSISGREKGYMMMHNLQWTSPGGFWQLMARYSVFSAPYNARIYASESDVSMFFQAPGYYNNGIRYYVLAAIKPCSKITLEARFAQSRYQPADTPSAGINNTIRQKTEISLMAKYLIN